MTDTSESPSPVNKSKSRNSWGIRIAFLALVLVAGGAAFAYYRYSQNFETTDDAFIESTIVRISSQVAGEVSAVHVGDNETVKNGDLLVELDARPFEIALESSQAAEALASSGQRPRNWT